VAGLDPQEQVHWLDRAEAHKLSVADLRGELRGRRRPGVTGAPAASQLRITSVVGSPAIFVGHSALTVIGIVKSAQQEGQALLGVIVPPYAASVIAGANDERRVIARTAPGAAQVVGRQGPYALDPYAPSQITAEVPPDPSTLRATVQGSLTNLLKILGFVGLGIGLLTITAITMLSVSQRRPEIGLRRALGYRRADIARLIVIEAAATGVLGGILGSAVGVIATVALASSSGWTPVLTAGLIPAAPLAGILVGALAGALPSIQAMRITPIAALRS
jgi:putative ABC transport system permease protein